MTKVAEAQRLKPGGVGEGHSDPRGCVVRSEVRVSSGSNGRLS